MTIYMQMRAGPMLLEDERGLYRVINLGCFFLSRYSLAKYGISEASVRVTGSS